MRRRLLAVTLLALVAVPLAGLLRFGRAGAAIASCTMACSGTERCCCAKPAAPDSGREAIPAGAEAFEARFERNAPGCPCAVPGSRTDASDGAAGSVAATVDHGSMQPSAVEAARAHRNVPSTCSPRAPPVSSRA